jgi:hypothetical protein
MNGRMGNKSQKRGFFSLAHNFLFPLFNSFSSSSNPQLIPFPRSNFFSARSLLSTHPLDGKVFIILPHWQAN